MFAELNNRLCRELNCINLLDKIHALINIISVQYSFSFTHKNSFKII